MVKAARTILARDGFAALTLEAVAAEAGVNKASTRYYFGNKEGLINATMAEIVLDECADHRPPDAPLTPDERVDAIIENVRAIALDPDSFTGSSSCCPRPPRARRSRVTSCGCTRPGSTPTSTGSTYATATRPQKRGAGSAMVLSAIIDGMAVQETIFGDQYEPGPRSTCCGGSSSMSFLGLIHTE